MHQTVHKSPHTKPPCLLFQSFCCLCPCLQAGEAEALRKVKILSWTGVASFLFSVVKWILSGADYNCGFGSWPAFGFKAMRYTWFLDFQQNYIGAGKEGYAGMW